jgi:hypothetical protein
MRHFHFENIVTLVEQLLLFTKSFNIFFAHVYSWRQRGRTTQGRVNAAGIRETGENVPRRVGRAIKPGHPVAQMNF